MCIFKYFPNNAKKMWTFCLLNDKITVYDFVNGGADMAKKKKKWLKFRHRVVRNIACVILHPYSRLKYGIQIEKFKDQKKGPYLILYNHQTPFDQFFVGIAFKGPVYYLATEDIFSKGWISSLIRWLVAPIPIKKQTTDLTAVKNCLRVAREGGTICIAPEGNRTYSGRTEYMSPAIGALAKKLGLPIALYRIEGGYGVQPRWSDGVRKGKMKGYVSRVIEPEEYKKLSADELFDLIEKGLFVDENRVDGVFRSPKRGEYLERMVYVCPFCGLSSFRSEGSGITCLTCGAAVEYNEDKTLTGVDCTFPYRFAGEWYDAQKDFVNRLDVTEQVHTPYFTEQGELWDVQVKKKKTCLETNMEIKLYGNRVELGNRIVPFDDISTAAVLGRNKLNLYYGDNVWQVRGDKGFNALKYVHLIYRYKNMMKGEKDGEFLGL